MEINVNDFEWFLNGEGLYENSQYITDVDGKELEFSVKIDVSKNNEVNADIECLTEWVTLEEQAQIEYNLIKKIEQRLETQLYISQMD
tara:strand:- start:30119 stop:30382 length:264 start_codon:yes stop_codon:yes gene_type:complete